MDRARIIYDVVPISDVPENLRADNPKWWVRPSRILVSAEKESVARALVSRFQYPVETRGAEAERRTDERRHLITFTRVAAMLGAAFGVAVIASVLERPEVAVASLVLAVAAVGVGLIIDAFRA